MSHKPSLYIIEFVHQSPALWLTDNIRGSAHENIGKELVQWSIAKVKNTLLKNAESNRKTTKRVVLESTGHSFCMFLQVQEHQNSAWTEVGYVDPCPTKTAFMQFISSRFSIYGCRSQVPELSRQDSYKSRFETMGLSSEPGRSGDGWRSCRITPFWMGSLMEWQWSLG